MSPLPPLQSNTNQNSHQTIPPPKRRWLTRYVLSFALLLLLSLILIHSAMDVVIPAQQVTTVRAIAHESKRVKETSVMDDTVSVQAPGWVEPEPFPIYVSSLTNGIVKNVYVLDGDKVESGQIVADLVDDDAQLDVSLAKAELARSQAELEAARDHWHRLSSLSPKAVAALELEKVKYQLDIVEAKVHATIIAVEQARLKLERTKIVSPTSGIVMKVLVSPGSNIMMEMDRPQAARVLHLYDPEKLQVRVDVPLQDAAKIYLDQFAEIVVDVLPSQSFKGQVTRFVHKADISKNTVQVKVRIDEPSPLLKPEMLARIKFFGSQQQDSSNASARSGMAVFIPEQAVGRSDGTDFVWLVEGSPERVRQQAVTLGTSKKNGWIEVISGVKIGAILVENPPSNLQAGDRVRSQNNLNKHH